MSIFTIYQNNSMLFSRACSSPLSLEEKNIILVLLKRCNFSNLKYCINIVEGDNYKKFIGFSSTSDEFISYFESLCREGTKYRVELHLN